MFSTRDLELDVKSTLSWCTYHSLLISILINWVLKIFSLNLEQQNTHQNKVHHVLEPNEDTEVTEHSHRIQTFIECDSWSMQRIHQK